MKLSEAAVILAKAAAWEHLEYSDGDGLKEGCELCQAIRRVRQEPVKVTDFKVRRSIPDADMAVNDDPFVNDDDLTNKLGGGPAPMAPPTFPPCR